MSVAFAVNAGPLAQVGLEIASLPTAFQLATGAYGWIKARERSQSLQELLLVSGGQLVSTSSFSLNRYKNIRSDHTSMQGVVVQDDQVQRTSLPKGSTAVPDNPGAACLRAITTGLLCLLKTEAVVEILQDVIPQKLVQLNQDDIELGIDDALLTSLKHWVSAVALEEDSDMFRKFMLEKIAVQQSRMMGAEIEEILNMDHTSVNELPLVIGLLRWILTPRHQRTTENYPTRSLKVWKVAFIMEIVGFEVQADPVVIQNIHGHESSLQTTRRFQQAPRIFLVVNSVEQTDPEPLVHVPRCSDSPKPQITMIRGIPWIAFRHLRGLSAGIDTSSLADVSKISFSEAKACFRKLTIAQQSISIEIESTIRGGIPEHQKSLMAEFSPQIEHICGTAVRHFLPLSPSSPGWNLSDIREQMNELRSEEDSCTGRSPCQNNCYILCAIVCGALYGLCSNMCFDSGNTIGEHSEVAFHPDLLYQNGGRRLKEWAKIIGHAIRFDRHHQVPLSSWSDLLFELFLGKDTESTAITSITAPSSTKYMNKQNPYPQRLYLGAQSNGLTAVSDLLVRMTTKMESLCYFHISRGQILNFPITEDNYIQASSHIEPALTLQMDPEPSNTVLHRFDVDCSDLLLRVDVEPCWDDDPRTVLFVLRSHGVPIATLNILAYTDRMSYDMQHCKCDAPSSEVSVRAAERWQLVSLYQLMRTSFKGMSFRRVDVSFADSKILIDGSQSIAATIYAICILHVRHLCLIRDCLACAYEHIMFNWQNSDAALIITC